MSSPHPPADWRWPVGRPRTTSLRTIDDDLQSLNIGVHTAWRKARDRDVWHQVITCQKFAIKEELLSERNARKQLGGKAS